jgi:spore coat polysaccharide biosynthesis protein SpsF
MKFSIIIQARLGSCRFPGKVLKYYKNYSILDILIKRIKKSKLINKIIIATTNKKKDQKIINYCKENKILFFRGSENDVLKRYYDAATKYNADIIVRITGDCPLIDPSIVSQVIRTFGHNNFDYVTNSNIRTYPDGMDVAVFSAKNLKKISNTTKNSHDREHVTLYFRRKNNNYSICNIMAPYNLHYPDLGLTLDEIKDFILIKKIFKKFKKNQNTFSCLEVVNFLKKNPELLKINRTVLRKSLPI